MQARILEKSEEGKWSEFIKIHPLATIHQMPQWGHFQAKISGRGKYWIVVLEETDSISGNASETRSRDQVQGQQTHATKSPRILGGTILIRHKLPKGYSWLYAARGPLLDYDSPDIQTQMATLLKIITKIAKEERAIFLRIDPPLENPDSQNTSSLLPPRGGRITANQANLPGFKNSKGFQPEHTIIIDLTPSEDEILTQMKQKCRYNIRLAEKKGVKVHKINVSNTEEFSKGIANFYNLLKQTTQRDHFHAHDEKFYKNMLETLAPNAALYLAEYQNQTIAGIIVTYFKDTATYYFGASGNEHRNLMAPYLLHWQAIKDAKTQGCQKYDLFGISPPDAKNHPWQSVTEFKNKFGGKPISYQKPQEYTFKKLMHLGYKLYKKSRL